jgi:hypothetical protein
MFLQMLLFSLMVILVYSCATTKPNFLNLTYEPTTALQKELEIKVALVKPIYTFKSKMQEAITTSPFGALMEKAMPADYKIKAKYNNDYVQRLRNAMLSDIEKILRAKGLKIVGNYENFDEITFSEKKNIDYVIMPEFDFGPVVRNQRQCLPVVGCQDKGTIQVIGNLKLVFYEPLSKEKVIIKRVDLSSLGYSSVVEYSGYEDADGKLIDLLNNIYPKLMNTIEKLIDVEEMENQMSNIRRLKEKNY